MAEKHLLVGTTSAGKTTLLREAKKHNWSVIPEIARPILEMTLLSKPELLASFAFQELLLTTQVELEQTLPKTKSSLLDRGIPDIIAHSILFGFEHQVPEQWYILAKNYDHVWLCDPADIEFKPTSLQLKLDPSRDWQAWRQELHQVYEYLLIKIYGAAYFSTVERLIGNVSERWQQIQLKTL